MTTAATSLLGLALPVTGELAGTWGTTVNDSITSLLDTAVAGTTTLSTDADVTLTTTTLAANQARQAILLCSGARTALRTITAPAQSKIYTIINATTGGFSVKLVGVGPTTGLTIPNGASAVVAWNGSDFIEVGSATVGNLTVNGNLSVTGTTSLTGVATLTANPVLSAGTANGVAYLNGSKVVTTGSALTFDGTNNVSLGSAGSSNAATSLTLNATDNSANGSYILGKRNGSNAWLIGDTASSLGSGSGFTSYNYGTAPWIWYLQTGGEQMRLTSTGLGIGTSSPVAKLDVKKTSSDTISRTNAVGGFGDWDSLGAGLLMQQTLSSPYGFALQAANAANSVQFPLLLNPSGGNVGIGTSSPADKLEVYSTITARAASGTSALRLRNTTSDYQWQTVAGTNAINLYDNAVGSSRLTVDSSGNLGLGVTPSAWNSTSKAIQVSAFVSVSQQASGAANFGFNFYEDAANTFKYSTTDEACRFSALTTGGFGWFTAPSGTAGNAITFTQAMTLTAAGRLGLGLTSPSTLFEAYGGAAGTSSELTVGNASTAARFGVDTSNEVTVATGQAVPIKFLTSNTERARITSGGYFKLGGDTSLNRHEVWQVTAGAYTATMGSQNGTAANCFGLQMYYSSASPNGTGNEFFFCVDNAATRMTVRSNGGIANYQANDVNLSDRREKTNFAPSKSYLDTICAIPVQTFNYIDQSEDDPGLTLGVVAQDVQAVAPELVMESNWGTEEEPKMRLSIYQTDLQYALMKCIQEQQTLITQLTERITALESK